MKKKRFVFLIRDPDSKKISIHVGRKSVTLRPREARAIGAILTDLSRSL